jgi:hypothetical protein
MTYSTCSALTSDCSTPASDTCNSVVRAEAQEALACLVVELRRLLAHRHDDTAIAAHELLADLCHPARLEAQSYQALYCRILRCRRAYGDSAPAQWGSVHRASCRAFNRLLWVWRVETLSCSRDPRTGVQPPHVVLADRAAS